MKAQADFGNADYTCWRVFFTLRLSNYYGIAKLFLKLKAQLSYSNILSQMDLHSRSII